MYPIIIITVISLTALYLDHKIDSQKDINTIKNMNFNKFLREYKETLVLILLPIVATALISIPAYLEGQKRIEQLEYFITLSE